MALFFEKIKGTTNGQNFTNILFQEGNCPKLQWKSSDKTVELGSILSTEGPAQTILKNFTFNNNGSTIWTTASDVPSLLEIDLQNNQIKNYGGKLTLTNDAIKINHTIHIKSDIDDVNSNDRVLNVNVPIHSTSDIQASYFLATSDKNAKENIKQVNESGLDIINSIPVYTFNYIENPKDRNIGIMVQDIESYSIDDFNFSVNGEPYKTIKETKLIYILWKGIQELSQKVTSLEKEIEDLKK